MSIVYGQIFIDMLMVVDAFFLFDLKESVPHNAGFSLVGA